MSAAGSLRLFCTAAAAAVAAMALPAAATAQRCPAAPAGPVSAYGSWTWTTDVGDRFARVTAHVAAPRGRMRLSGTTAGSSAVVTAPARGGGLGPLGRFTSISRPAGTEALEPPAGRLTNIRFSVHRRGARIVFSWLPAVAPAVLAEYALPEHDDQLRSSASLPLSTVCCARFDLHLRRHITLYAPGLRSTLKVTLVADLRIHRR